MQELIDLRTVMLISGVTSILLCFCMIYIFFTQITYAGFRQWAIAFSSLAAGMVLLSQRYIIPDFFSIILANLFVVLFIVLLAHGLSAFAGTKQRNWLYLSFLIIFFMVFSYFTYLRPNFNIRLIILSGSIVLFSICSLVIILQDISKILPGKAWFLIVYFIFNGTWFFLRLINALINEGVLYGFWASGIFEKATMVVSVEASVMSAIGLIIINTRRVAHELFLANNEIKTLKGFIPICASCKKIRDDKGFWNQLEKYISEHTDATFSHSICPECVEKLYPGKTKKDVLK